MLAFVLALLAAVRLGAGQPPKPAPVPRDTLDRLWQQVERAQAEMRNRCGALTETRTSPLLARPLVLTGRFCMAGTDRFRLDYAEPNPVRIIYNAGALNVSVDGGRNTEALEVGEAVGRTQRYFSGPDARKNLERDFAIEVTETGERVELALRPVAGRLTRRLSRVLVEFAPSDPLPRRLEIAGRNGVISRFDIRVTGAPATLDPGMFAVYRARPVRDPARAPGK